jgi:hypothetical protein
MGGVISLHIGKINGFLLLGYSNICSNIVQTIVKCFAIEHKHTDKLGDCFILHGPVAQ